MKLGLQIPNFTWPGGPAQLAATLRDVAQAADDGGLASVWVMDHFFQIPPVGAAELDMLEGYAALAFLAGVTKRVALGTMVTGVTYRHPGVLVKTVSTLDVLSGGRAVLGIGAAWFEREHVGLGVPFPPLRERFERLEEALRIAKQMWSGEVGRFDGRHYRLAETLCVPQPVSKPHPSILIGGRGEKKTLRLIAKYGDAWNMGTSLDVAGVDEFKRLSDVLGSHCEREGRPFAAIERTILTTVMTRAESNERWKSPAQVLDILGRYAAAGVDQVMVNMPFVEDPRTLDFLCEQIVPAVAKM